MSALFAPLCGWCGGYAQLDRSTMTWVCVRDACDRTVKTLTPHERLAVDRLDRKALKDKKLTGKDLRTIRMSMYMTQEQLAERLGVTGTTLYRWETGRWPIEHPRMLALALQRLQTLG